MKLSLYFVLLGCLLTLPTYAQIGMGGQPHPSAVLDLKSPDNNKGLLVPRLSTAQRNAIASPAVGLLVFDLDKGTLYLHDGQNWLPLAITSANNLAPIDRLASDGATGDNFGVSVAISGDYALVGATGDDIGANADQGSAYVFIRSGSSWIQQAKLTATDGAANDLFGVSVAISGDYALVGAYGDAIGANSQQGSAYVFVRSGSSWTQQAKLTAADGAAFDYFGISVAISGDYALVGAYLDDIGANIQQGSAYVFKRTGTSWSPVRPVIDNSPFNTQNGFGVGISNGTFIIGGPGFESNKGKVAFGTVDN